MNANNAAAAAASPPPPPPFGPEPPPPSLQQQQQQQQAAAAAAVAASVGAPPPPGAGSPPSFPGDVPGFPLGAYLNLTMPPGISRTFDVRSFSLALYQVEVLFVLSTLSGGKIKRKVQTELAKEGLGLVLCDLFEHIQWDCSKDNPHVRVHGPGCECNPESALRIQFLRLVRNFSENSEGFRVKRTLFSRLELDDLRKLADIQKLPEAAEMFGDGVTVECFTPNPKGLLIKILETIQKPSDDSNHKVFMASAIEGYLRGAPLTDRIFLVNHGLLDFIFAEILKKEDDGAKSMVQSLFDLLGETLKFSPQVLLQVDALLSPEQREQLVELSLGSLISSNVFVRALYLTAVDAKLTDPSDCRLAAFVVGLRERVRLVKDLIGCITVTDLNQENICCLNTSLVFFIHANRNNELTAMLRMIRADELREEKPGRVLKILLQLVEFWSFFYGPGVAKRQQDCEALQRSSKIPFTEWRSVVNVQLLGASDSPLAIKHWLDKADVPPSQDDWCRVSTLSTAISKGREEGDGGDCCGSSGSGCCGGGGGGGGGAAAAAAVPATLASPPVGDSDVLALD